MTADPAVSVVMSVFNDARYLTQAMESILRQEGVDFEFIIVDDGATDESPRILDEYAERDSRVRVVHKPNEGLTRALIDGCALASGEFIARQDADDLSLPGRLARLVRLLEDNPSLVLASSWANVIGPEGEVLLTHERPADPEEATREMLYGTTSPPGHGSVMFRKSVYEEVGGYHPEFYYAQDSDLWLRMGLIGKVGYVQEVLYHYRLSPSSISGALHHVKVPFAQMVADCHQARLAGESDAPIIARAPVVVRDQQKASASSEARQLYFIGRCLLARHDLRAEKYLWRCVRKNPFHWRGWIRLASALMFRLSRL